MWFSGKLLHFRVNYSNSLVTEVNVHIYLCKIAPWLPGLLQKLYGDHIARYSSLCALYFANVPTDTSGMSVKSVYTVWNKKLPVETSSNSWTKKGATKCLTCQLTLKWKYNLDFLLLGHSSNKFSSVARHRINLHKVITFLYTNNKHKEKEFMDTPPFTIGSEKIYQGINLKHEIKDLYSGNLKLMKKERNILENGKHPILKIGINKTKPTI